MNWNDETMVLEMIRENPWMYRKVSERLKMDRTISLEAVKEGVGIRDIPMEIRDDEEIVLACIRAHYVGILAVPEQFRMKREIVKEAVRALQYVPAPFKDNDEIVGIALSQNREALQYASECYRSLAQ